MDKDGMVYVAQSQRYLDENKKLKAKVKRLKKELDKPVTEHPDVQRLIGQVVELQAEIKGLKDLFKIVRARSMDYAHRTGEYHRDLSIIHESAVEALKGNTND